jgi:hypothetical protein
MLLKTSYNCLSSVNLTVVDTNRHKSTWIMGSYDIFKKRNNKMKIIRVKIE